MSPFRIRSFVRIKATSVPHRRTVSEPESRCSKPTYVSPSSGVGSTRSAICSAISANTTRVQPFLPADSGIGHLLNDDAVERLDQRIHLLPELPAAGVERGPRCLEILPAAVTCPILDWPDVTRDRQVAILLEHFGDR